MVLAVHAEQLKACSIITYLEHKKKVEVGCVCTFGKSN